jgi:hypothetical protein
VTYEMDDEGAVSLRHIGQGCYIYANDNGDRFPETLEELVGLGCCRRAAARVRGSAGRRIVYLHRGADRVRRRAQCAGLRAHPRAGGHARAVHGQPRCFSVVDELRVALRATYERLDRADEMPAELR